MPPQGCDPLRLDEWLPMYRDICADFGYDERADERSAGLLWSLLSSRQVPTLKELEDDCPSRITLCGDGPSLAQELIDHVPEGFVVAADGATSALVAAGVTPDAVVTDLDGPADDLLRAGASGARMFVHAHGDNTDAVTSVVPRLKGEVVGTCQCPPVGGLLNLGGFTDGDRAACIFSGLGTKRILLVGFDLGSPSAKPGRDPEVKRRKLAWARMILLTLSERGVEIDGLKDRH